MTHDYITLEQLIDITQQGLTFSGLLPRILPDREIKRIIREEALEWFYKNYQFSVQKSYFYLGLKELQSDLYTQYKYFILPEEIENITRIIEMNDPSLFRLGIQAPHLSINLGVTNQPFLTSFVTTVGELGVYRSVLSAFSDEINKMNKPTLKFSFSHINKRLQILTSVKTNLMLEVYVRIEPEELFAYEKFKNYVLGKAQMRLGEAIGQLNIPLPGGFQYNANDIISSGEKRLNKVEEEISKQVQNSFFIMSR